MYECKILADSVCSRGHRLTTFQVTYPRMIHSEFMTHGMFVRNSESSRARPVQKNIADVENNPFVPEAFGKNQPGMQFEELLSHNEDAEARSTWRFARDDAIAAANALAELEVHKSYANRVMEPYKWHTALYTATDWSNFFALRTHPDAQKEFQVIAKMMRETYEEQEPRHLSSTEWHLPLVNALEMEDYAFISPDPDLHTDWEFWKKVSIGRCARVSYLTHEGKRDTDADLKLYDRLLESGHMSPFGHVARPFNAGEWELIDEAIDHVMHYAQGYEANFAKRLTRNLQYCAQYRGWWQARADIPNEHDFSLILAGRE